jgi:hypothetical protein
VALAEWLTYRRRCDLHADEREAIRREVLAELFQKHGRDFRLSMGGRWTIGALTQRRFAALMIERYGIRPPQTNPDRHPIVYGGGRS